VEKPAERVTVMPAMIVGMTTRFVECYFNFIHIR